MDRRGLQEKTMDSGVIADLSSDFRAFVGRAVEACDRGGEHSVLLLVGSRAAGFTHGGSDLDLWIIGDKKVLTPEQQRLHDAKGGLFVDRGDYEAHWHFYDEAYFVERLCKWPAEMMWILGTAKYLHGRRETFEVLRERFLRFPREVAESKLRWLLGCYRDMLSPMFKVACLGRTADAWAIGGEAINSLWKLCCVAECLPWPYRKWLGEVARKTRVGAVVAPFVQRSVDLFQEYPRPLEGEPGPEWPPRKQLRLALDAMIPILQDIGWKAEWIADPMKALDEAYLREYP